MRGVYSQYYPFSSYCKLKMLRVHPNMLLLSKVGNHCYHEISISIYTVKLHVLSLAILKCEYKELRNRKCKCKSHQFL